MRPGFFCWQFASFAYSTPSSTDEAPRSRVVFVFAEPITTPERYREVYQALAWTIAQDGGHADPQCKDPLRLYYGSPGCKVIPNWAVLTPEVIEVVLGQYAAAHPPQRQEVAATPLPKPNGGDYAPRYVTYLLEKLCDNIRYAPDGERHGARLRNARTAGGYIATGVFDRYDAEGALVAAAVANTSNPASAEKTIRDGIEYGLQHPLYPSVPAEYTTTAAEAAL
jgi:hypothetical protein